MNRLKEFWNSLTLFGNCSILNWNDVQIVQLIQLTGASIDCQCHGSSSTRSLFIKFSPEFLLAFCDLVVGVALAFDCGKEKETKETEISLQSRSEKLFWYRNTKIVYCTLPYALFCRLSQLELIKICISSKYRHAWLITKEFSVMDWKFEKLNSRRLVKYRSLVFSPTGEMNLFYSINVYAQLRRVFMH